MIEPRSTRCRCRPRSASTSRAGVRTLLRQDPDIIMVGEIRDRETADMAIQAALTGHLVLSTLHTNDAPTRGHAAARSRRAAVPDHLDAAGRHGAAPGAHAVPALQVPASRRTTRPGLITSPWQAEKPQQVMAPEGCLECRMTGYRGRIGIYEIMLMTPAMRRMITTRRTTRGFANRPTGTA